MNVGEILGIKVMENKKQSEIVAVQDLLELLDLREWCSRWMLYTVKKNSLSNYRQR